MIRILIILARFFSQIKEVFFLKSKTVEHVTSIKFSEPHPLNHKIDCIYLKILETAQTLRYN